jgi:hypothetical protein
MVLGLNENVKYKGCLFHIQTEDMGEEKAVMVCTLFYKGLVIERRVINYSKILEKGIKKENFNLILEALHKKVKKSLLEGSYDEKIKNIIKKGKDDELLQILHKCILPDLKNYLGIEFTDEELQRIEEELTELQEVSSKEKFLALCSVVFNKISDRVEGWKYKELVKKWALKSKEEDEVDIEEFKALLRKIVHADIKSVVGESLSEALQNKIINEVHPFFLKQPQAFEVIVERILNSGLLQKRTDEKWRQIQRERWLDMYRNLTDSGIMNV